MMGPTGPFSITMKTKPNIHGATFSSNLPYTTLCIRLSDTPFTIYPRPLKVGNEKAIGSIHIN